MNKFYIKVKPLCNEECDANNKSLDDLKNSSLGKVLQKLFDVGYVNTTSRFTNLSEIHSVYFSGWLLWDTIIFGHESSCKNVFYMQNSRDIVGGDGGQRVSLKYVLSL